MAISSLQDMLVYNLCAAYDAEKMMQQGMQLARGQAKNGRVQQMLDQHITESQQQTKQLEQCFSALGQQPKPVKCYAIEGLINDFKAISQQIQNPPLIDLGILGIWAMAEHLEIAAYGGMVGQAQIVGNGRVVQILQQILNDEESEAKLVEQAAKDLGQQLGGGGMTRAAGGNP